MIILGISITADKNRFRVLFKELTFHDFVPVYQFFSERVCFLDAV